MQNTGNNEDPRFDREVLKNNENIKITSVKEDANGNLTALNLVIQELLSREGGNSITYIVLPVPEGNKMVLKEFYPGDDLANFIRRANNADHTHNNELIVGKSLVVHNDIDYCIGSSDAVEITTLEYDFNAGKELFRATEEEGLRICYGIDPNNTFNSFNYLYEAYETLYILT